MANDQDKTGQQGGTAQNNPGGSANDPQSPSEPGQRGGQMQGGQSDMVRQRESQGGGRGSSDGHKGVVVY